MPSFSPSARSTGVRVGVLLVLLAFLLRLGAALDGSFFLDDFHSLYHARVAGLGAFLEELTRDNHPPLSFLVLRGARALFGEAPLALRLPNILLGTWTVWITWHLSGRLRRTGARSFATAIVALSSLHLDLSSNLRMYALLGLALLGVLASLLDLVVPPSPAYDARRASARLALWTATALLTHYFGVHALFLLFTTLLVLALRGRVPRAAVRRVAMPLAVALLLVAPWYAWGLPRQLAHGLAPGGASVSPRIVGEALVHLVYLRASLLGPLRVLAIVAGLVSVSAALLGGLRLLRKREEDARLLAALAGTLAFGLPVWSALVAALVPRSGFEWRYLAPSIAPFALLVGAALTAPLPALVRRVLPVLVLVPAFLIDLAWLQDPGPEDYRGATQFVVAQAQAGDAVLAMDWQPRLFPHAIGWSYYAPREGAPDDLVPLAYTDDFALADPTALDGLGRVFCVLRSIPAEAAALRTLRSRFDQVGEYRFGEGVLVLEFRRRD